MRPVLTVLTDPIPVGKYCLSEQVKCIARQIRDLVKPPPPYMRSRYRGHFAVTRSLVEGLQKVGANANYNPETLVELGEVVVVLSSVEALEQAIQLKRAGRIRRLLAGPNLVVFPSEIRDLLCASEIDWHVVPSDWVRDMYEDDWPGLRGRCAVWPAGVDTDYWCPSPALKNEKKVLIFEKQNKGPVGPIAKYVPIVERRGYEVNVIVYGNFLPDQYLRRLQEACVMIGFVTDESQGIAWAEAWSTDVPTLLWYQDRNSYKGKAFFSSTAPYLSDETGLFFSSLNGFEAVFSQWQANRQNFHPRQWVLENMSDEVCARKLCDLAGVSV